MKRGQAAMEFLMTYGWAILVVLIAIGALAYFGVLNPARFLPSSCTITPGFSCDNFKVDTAGNLQLVLRNGAGQDFTSVSVAVATCTTSTPTDWAEGDILGGAGGITLTGCTVGVQGSRFKQDITLAYTDQGGITHSKTGKIVTEVETP